MTRTGNTAGEAGEEKLATEGTLAPRHQAIEALSVVIFTVNPAIILLVKKGAPIIEIAEITLFFAEARPESDPLAAMTKGEMAKGMGTAA
tara:strand:- start:140 stop:409 length:270 start_codon:yes stop_codon:yes gene_type:complete